MALPVLPVVLLCVLVWTPVHGYPNGPPVTACLDMTPNHGPNAQASAPPYTIDLGAIQSYTPGSRLSVTIKNVGSGTKFRGTMLQARRKGMDTIVGSFEAPQSGFKRLDCDGGTNNALVHSNRDVKSTDQTFLWKAPPTDEGEIEFVATIVQVKNTFWLRVKSIAIPAVGGTPPGGLNTTATTVSGTTEDDETNHAAPTACTTGVLAGLVALLLMVYLH